VAGTLWQIPDVMTRRITTDVYRRMVSRAEAPERAFAGALRSVAREARDPGLWAAWTVSVAIHHQESR
jgi:CHAT domain-containing protein